MPTSLSVLIVDDRLGGSGPLTAALSRHGHTVHVAHTAAEAKIASGPPDVVILDTGFTDGDGVDLVERFSRLPLRPLVIMRSLPIEGSCRDVAVSDADWIVGLVADYGRSVRRVRG